jgi:hypothetical protein
MRFAALILTLTFGVFAQKGEVALDVSKLDAAQPGVYQRGIDDGKAAAFTAIVQSEKTIEARPVDVAAITPGSAASRMGILADTSLRSNPRKRDSLMSVAYTKDSLDNAKHTPVMQQGPVDMPKVQVEAGRVATVTVIVSDADGSNAMVAQSSKITSDAGEGLVTDIYAGFRIAQNQPKDKP